MTRGDFIFPALLFVATAVLLLLGAFYYHYPFTTFAFPCGVGLALCGMCIYEMFRVLTGRSQMVPVDPDDPTVTLSLASLGWMFALLPFLYLFGFIFGSAAYLLVCLKANGFSWKLAVSTAVVALAAGWGVFIHVFGLLLPVWPMWMS
jgi:hypothetical protein